MMRSLPPPRTGAPAQSSGDPTTRTLLKSALRIAGLGCWTWNLSTGAVELSAEAEAIFGGAGPLLTFESWLRWVEPADAGRLPALEQAVLAGQRTFSFEYSFTGPDGSRRRLKTDGEVVSLDEHGTPLVAAGTVLDLGDARPEQPRDAGLSHPGWWSVADRAVSWRWEQDASYRFTLLEGGEQRRIPELEAALGRARWQLPHAVPLASSWGEHIRMLEARLPFREFEYRIGDGARAASFSVSGDPVHDAEGRFHGYRGTAHEITRRVHAEEDARHARLLLRQASRLARVGAWTLGIPGMSVEWTPEAARLFGCASDAPVAWEAAFAALQEPYLSELQDHVAACVAPGRAFRMEARLSLEDGQERWLEIAGEPERSFSGPCRRVIGAVNDVTERKLAAHRLHEVNQQLATTFESITSGFYTLDRQWRFTYANHETERVAQRPRSELLGRSILELFPWFGGSPLHLEYERALSQGRAAHVEVFLDALGVWGEVHAYPSPQGLTVYFQDITDRKLARDALRASEERHRLLFQVSLDALVQVEHGSGRIVAANAAACRMFRMSEARILGRGRCALVAPREPRAAQLLAEVDAAGSGRGCLTLLRGDGTEFDAELSGALFRGADGVVYASVAIRDISERLRQEAEIRALTDSLAEKVRERTLELEAANDELKAFAHSLAHDLRTPIAAITALSHVLEQRMQGAAEKDRQYATRIRQAAQQLDEYVVALLEHARLSQASLTPRRVNLTAMAEAILEDLRMRDPHRAVATHVQPGLATVGDRTLLRMVLENLLGNAWKFTRERPDAQIRFGTTGDADGSSTFCVSDNGAGFDMEYGHKLFGAFERLHTQAEFPGTGIGLANVKRIVARHGGRVWATGTPGAGASFFFALPHGSSEPARPEGPG
ncbi:PAS domain S-box protein [Ramlibacter sp. USB13]|uniref:histidine kinase n=1 Tax=Ramlibacter cellulosilyticus TaxID=2764187 RepID=A0A923MVF5_9BURK|nr:PAS domain S-box protein [Ramlibacter cellulosilyticus]MBC5785448.1 PAS domain S-box protein [Ramlibacter cellulosilyticus]